MALIDSKQLNPKFSGSFILSGSAQSFISEQVVIGSNIGSATAHSNAALTILMGGKSGMMLPSASADPTGLGTSDKGLLYFDATDSLLKTFDGVGWIPVGDLNTKNTHLSMSADIDGDGANSSIIFRIDGQDNSNVKLRLRSDNSHHVTGSVNVSGSIVATSLATGSTSVTSNNTTAGYPGSYKWGSGLDGSYFNRFTGISHISDIVGSRGSVFVIDSNKNKKSFLNKLAASHKNIISVSDNPHEQLYSTSITGKIDVLYVDIPQLDQTELAIQKYSSLLKTGGFLMLTAKKDDNPILENDVVGWLAEQRAGLNKIRVLINKLKPQFQILQEINLGLNYTMKPPFHKSHVFILAQYLQKDNDC